ncbi:MAG: NAD(P)H-dependent glycerol-3-phosphate dehydrogenase [Tissierellia bacterium]|nr:NAD(P)H-dependent glycerol-3-phosphate dehydrogenase [Tissierellia bacterium]
MTKVLVMGGGSWGTALARILDLNSIDTTMFIRNKEQYRDLVVYKENKRYLPGFKMPSNLKYSNDYNLDYSHADAILMAVPTNSFRQVLSEFKDKIRKDAIIINCAKGIEENSLKRLSEVSKEIAPENPYAVISGPTHAEEVIEDLPSTIVSASENIDIAKTVQNYFMSQNFRVYTNEDLIGVELGGALKNIIALATGILDGIGFGDNTKAALMTRGIAEISRLGTSLGARPETFFGLTGIGDLIVTCTSMHSRNRRCGILIGEGKTLDEAVQEVGMVVEGVKTTNAAYKLAKNLNVDMPITKVLYEVLYKDKKLNECIEDLMLRKRKNEMEGLF